MRVRLTLTEEMLGTQNANPEIHEEFIASKSKDAAKSKEELEALPQEALMEKAVMVFPRDADGTPMLWDYQIRGFLKHALGVLIELDTEEIKVGKTKVSKFTHKRIVDDFVFVKPRRIRMGVKVGPICTRPLRGQTMQGERISLASSETVPAGTVIEFDVNCLSAALEDIIKRCLDYGALHGLGQWRNSGKGTFSWEEVK